MNPFKFISFTSFLDYALKALYFIFLNTLLTTVYHTNDKYISTYI